MTDAKPETVLTTVSRLAAALAEWPEAAAIVGGVAVVARVRPRLTTDIDVVIRVLPDEAEHLLALLTKHGWEYDREETALLIEGGLARLWRPPSMVEGVGLDLIFADSPFLDGLLSRATPTAIGDAVIAVATVEDLLLMKLEANRPQDIDDILAIKDACASTLDMTHVAEQARALGVTDRLELYFGG